MHEASESGSRSRSRDEAPSLTKEALELLRTRELYKYFEPLTTPTDGDSEEHDAEKRASSPDTDDDGQTQNSRPLSTSDPVLGSLMLLAERLLSADRVILILADQYREYLIADSGQAMTHFTGEISSSPSPRAGSWKKRCRRRKDLFSVFIQPVEDENRLVIEVVDSELPENDKWRHEWPDIRRYAGVPIKTRAGSIIGVLCTLYKDPKREGTELTEKYEKTFAKLTSAVMRYLEVVRGEREKKRGRKMEIALSRFIAGNFSPDKVALTGPSEGSMRVETSQQESTRMDDEREDEAKARNRKEFERWRGREAKRKAAGIKDDSCGVSPRSSPVTSMTPADPPQQTTETTSYFDSRTPPKRRNPSTSRSAFSGKYGLPFKAPDRSPPLRDRKMNRKDSSREAKFSAGFLAATEPHTPLFLPDGESISTTASLPASKKGSTAGSEAASVNSLPVNVAAAHRALFMRAADLMRNGMHVDGVAFVNADLEGLSDFEVPGQTSPLNHTSSDTHTSEVVRAERAKESKTRSGILGFSGGWTSKKGGTTIPEVVGVDVSELSEEYLRTLTESWPRGCIFTYSRDPKHPVIGISVNPNDSSDSDDKVDAAPENIEVVDIMRRFMPGSKSVIFVPLYDWVGKVFGVGFAWTSSGIRAFRGDVEGSFMAAFCDSIMQEVSRLHVVSANVAKSNFISTISHELRSPLHGILASCELFRETVLSEYEKELVNTIHSCGKTLLDTVNNVLTFTKLNTKANARKDATKLRKDNPPDGTPVEEFEKIAAEPAVPDIDLAELAEEVVEASYVGYRFSPTPEQQRRSNEDGLDVSESSKQHVHVTLEIDPELGKRRFAVPPGSFRRLVLNLSTNALKYTDNGWVRLWLGMRGEQVFFTVADSGRGISREFLKKSLFTPFVQEFPMHSGTGLGMSIVRQLVDELGGTIDVRSQVDVGTEVCIALTLDSVISDEDEHSPEDSVYWQARRTLRGRKIAVVGLDDPSRVAQKYGATKDALAGLRSFFKRTLTATFGMVLVEKNLEDLRFGDAECAIVHRGPVLDKFLARHAMSQTSPVVPLIELGGGRAGGHGRPPSPADDARRCLVVLLARPYCPRKIAAALLCATQRRKSISGALGIPTPSPTPPQQSSTSRMNVVLPSDDALPTVLIVEDNMINMRLLACYFEKNGYPFEKAVNGLEAFQAVQRRHIGFDVILMDLQMPVMSGTDATRAIRALEAERGGRRCFIIALTALSGDDAKLEANRAGVDMFLVKPVKMVELKGLLNQQRRSVVNLA